QRRRLTRGISDERRRRRGMWDRGAPGSRGGFRPALGPYNALIELPGLELRFHAELTLERVEAEPILPERLRAPALTVGQPHQFAMGRLVRRIERQDAHRGHDRGLRAPGILVMGEEPRERVEGEHAEPLPLTQQPLVEWRFLYADPREQFALVEQDGLVESNRRATSRERLGPDDVDVESGTLDPRVTMVGQKDRVGAQGAPERRKRLPQTLPRVLFARVGPEQCGDLIAGVPAPRSHRKVRERGLCLARQVERLARAQARLETSKEDERDVGFQKRLR